MPTYRWNLLPMLGAAIERGGAERARELLGELLEEVRDGADGDVRLYGMRCAQCLSVCLRAARRAGAAGDRLYLEHLGTLRRIVKARRIADVQSLVRRSVEGLLLAAGGSRATRMERIVAAITADLGVTIANPRTLGHYAQRFQMSEGHLSRAFARIAGRPFGEERRRLRDERAARLLLGTRLPIAEITARVGVRSPAQFVADFRRRHGITPARFRRGTR